MRSFSIHLSFIGFYPLKPPKIAQDGHFWWVQATPVLQRCRCSAMGIERILASSERDFVAKSVDYIEALVRCQVNMWCGHVGMC